jgi:hypothetical protein
MRPTHLTPLSLELLHTLQLPGGGIHLVSPTKEVQSQSSTERFGLGATRHECHFADLGGHGGGQVR